jgi:hypothetical protein
MEKILKEEVRGGKRREENRRGGKVNKKLVKGEK